MRFASNLESYSCILGKRKDGKLSLEEQTKRQMAQQCPKIVCRYHSARGSTRHGNHCRVIAAARPRVCADDCRRGLRKDGHIAIRIGARASPRAARPRNRNGGMRTSHGACWSCDGDGAIAACRSCRRGAGAGDDERGQRGQRACPGRTCRSGNRHGPVPASGGDGRGDCRSGNEESGPVAESLPV